MSNRVKKIKLHPLGKPSTGRKRKRRVRRGNVRPNVVRTT